MAVVRTGKLRRTAEKRAANAKRITMQYTAYHTIYRVCRFMDWRWTMRWMLRERKVIALVFVDGKHVGNQHIGNARMELKVTLKDQTSAQP